MIQGVPGITMSPPGGQFVGEDGGIYAIVACVLRNTGSGWGVITEPATPGHKPINVASVTNSTTTITVTYSFTAKYVGAFLCCPDETFIGGSGAPAYRFGASVGESTAVISIWQEASTESGYVSYNGTEWDMTYAPNMTATFSSGVLTITHPSVSVTNGIGGSATARGGVYIASLGSCGATTTAISFYDYAGNLITSPDTNMRVFFTRMNTTGGQVNPNDVTSSAGNIWCLGVFQI